MNQPTRIGLHEGSVEMPAAYEDRSSHLFVPPDLTAQPNLGIARDWLKEDETLADYVDRQLAQLQSRLPGRKLLARKAERLGAGEGSLEGERVDAQYRSGQQTIRQRQAVFLVAPRRALIFTASTAGFLDEDTDALWAAWLASYRPSAAGAGTPAEVPASPEAASPDAFPTDPAERHSRSPPSPTA